MKPEASHFIEFFIVSLKNLLRFLQIARNQRNPVSQRLDAIAASRKLLQTLIDDVERGVLPGMEPELCKKLAELYVYAKHQLDQAERVETTPVQRVEHFDQCELIYRRLRAGFEKLKKKSKHPAKAPGPNEVH
jgi:hypothetical protein